MTICTNSNEALVTFQNQPDRFDAVVTDQTMSGMTGIELAKQLLRIRKDIPIILCTGYSTVINEEQGKAEDVEEFVMKSLTQKLIAPLLRKVLDD